MPSAPVNGEMGRRLYILGSGMFTHRQLTAETLDAIRNSDVVLHLTMPDVHAFLRALGGEVVDLGDLYTPGVVNLDVYERIVRTVLSRTAVHATVAYLVLGHPRLFDRSVHMLMERAPLAGIETTVLPGVSAFDAILMELDVDIGETGLQIHEANRLKLHRRALDPTVPLLIFQLGVFGSRIITRGAVNRPTRLVPLVEYLAAFYGESHEVLVLECQIAERHAGARLWVKLSELPAIAERLNYNSTLFVPAARKPEVVDRSFERRLLDPRSVRRLVE